MKKIVILVMTFVMLMMIAVSASAAKKDFVIRNAPCDENITKYEIYKYNGGEGITKIGNDETVKIKHSVRESNAGYTNLIAAYCSDTGKSMGASWKPSDNQYYLVSSGAIKSGQNYTACGRGNTKYLPGYPYITIQGTIDTYDD